MRDLAIIVRPGPGTDEELLGLRPAVRTAHALLGAGVERLWLIAEDGTSAERVLRDLPDSLGRRATLLEAARGEVEALRRIAAAGAGVLIVVRSDIVVGKDAAQSLASILPPPAGIAVLRDGVAIVSAEALHDSHAVSLADLRSSLEASGRVASPEVPGLIGSATDPSSRRAVEQALLQGLRKPLEVEGVVGYYIQRPLTRHLSRLLVRTPIRPNHLSVLAMIAGVLSGVLVATADPGWTALGGVLFFGGSLLDCLDGEVARLRFQCSYVGEWLDTLADDLSTLSFLTGMTWNLHTRYGSILLDAVGAISILEFVLASAYVYHRIATVHHSGDVTVFRYSFQREDGTSRSRVLWLLKWVVKRDFFSAWFCGSALAGAIEVAFGFSAAGAFGFALAVVITALAGANGTRALVRDARQVTPS